MYQYLNMNEHIKSLNLCTRVSVCLFFIHLHTVAPISSKFGMMVQNLPGYVRDN
jgi:hypothetical protein